MPTDVPRREFFSHPERLSPAWSLIKNGKTATCEVWSHVLGFELRALVGAEPVLTRVCRSQEELVLVQEEWHAMFTAKGWQPRG